MADILEVLKYIPVDKLHYGEWIDVGMALKNEGYDVSVWDEWSQNDTRYHAGECEEKWKSFTGGGITGGTIVHLAQQYGYCHTSTAGEIPWDGSISYDGSENLYEMNTIPDEWRPTEQLIEYLETLFKPDDIVGYVNTVVLHEDRLSPTKGVYDRTAGELIASLKKYPDDIGATVGDWNEEAGAWIRFNPVDGNGVKNENVTAFRYALVESDIMSVADQDAMYRKLELPIVFLVHSGGKSLHAIVHIDAENYDEYRKRVEFLYDFLEKNGVTVDKQNRNPSRLSRMPGITRNGKHQYITAKNIGRKSWDDWMDYVEGVSDELPDVETLSKEMVLNPPELSPVLIEGILRCGHKMLISGSSKVGKSFLLMEMAIAISEGTEWLGFKCRKGHVLYINLEIDRNSCINRFSEIYKALGIECSSDGLDLWNLRGKALPLDKLVPKLLRRMKSRAYDAVIIDPIYKVITGDENNASEMSTFCNQFDRICTETGAAAIYCHHHSKGLQGNKKAIDRASGSGVFARDPDAQLDVIQLELSQLIIDTVQDRKSNTAFRLEGSLREFPNFGTVNFWFDYPIHRVDNEHLKDAKAEGQLLTAGTSNEATEESTPPDSLESLQYAFECNQKDGKCTVEDFMEYLGKTERTVYRYLKKYPDYFDVKSHIVTYKSAEEEPSE